MSRISFEYRWGLTDFYPIELYSFDVLIGCLD